ncbi:MAG: rubrerythrin family protein [bacterium]|nr:rubrerythrin family protein [bacterium]
MNQKTTLALVAALAVGAFGGGLAIGAGTQLAPVTKTDLMSAMHGEAFAYAKYMAYARQAREHGNASLAALYERTAAIELNAHFAVHAQEYGLVGSDAANLEDSIAGENYETTTMYPRFANDAQRAGNTHASALFRSIGADEANHRDRFRAALAALKKSGG